MQLIPITTALLLSSSAALAQSPGLPDAAGKDTVQRVCGACHPATVVVGQGRTREEWGQVVASMISRGAKGSASDFATVTDYLAKNLGPGQATGNTRSPRRMGLSAGPSDKQVIDTELANRGQALYSTDCGSCHGDLARGGANGPDLVRSAVLLHDRYGNTLGPYLQHKHPNPQGTPIARLGGNEILELSHFLHEQVDDTLRSGPYTKVLNVMTGDAQTGAEYFRGNGGCSACHSPTGDLAGIATRYDPPTLQQRLLFPRTVALGRGRPVLAAKPTTITVTEPNGEAISGTLVRMDDFNVALRDGAGAYHSWTRTRDLKIELHDPYSAHEELLDKISDKDIHNLVAYLETLK